MRAKNDETSFSLRLPFLGTPLVPSRITCVCLSVCLSVCQSVCLSVCLSVCQSVSLSVSLSVCQSVFLLLLLRTDLRAARGHSQSGAEPTHWAMAQRKVCWSQCIMISVLIPDRSGIISSQVQTNPQSQTQQTVHMYMCMYMYMRIHRLITVISLLLSLTSSSLLLSTCHSVCLSVRPSVRPSVSRLTLSPPTKSLDFRGFDSSKLLILRGGNSHVRWIL